MTALRRYAWVAAVAAALILGPADGAHSGADWEAAYADIDWEEIRRAAEGGDAEAQIELGNAYLEDADALGASHEIPQDDVQAYLWLSLGVAGLANADTDTLMIARDFATEDLRRLEKRMTPLQLTKARRFIHERRGSAPQAEQASTIREAQHLLRELGYAPGPADGKWGPRTERAFRSYLREADLPDVAFSAQVLEGMREATRSAAGHAVRAEQPGTNQAETSEGGAGGTTETILYDNRRYVGPTRGGKPHGRGVMTWVSGTRYEGDFVDGRWHGHGVFIWADGKRYEGDFVDGERTGRGVYTWPDGERYEGDFVDGEQTGRGVFTSPNGHRYEGDFVEGKPTGHGVFTWRNGDRYEGDFVEGKLTGRGVFTWLNGHRYEGDFVEGKRTGHGVYTWPNGNRYQGDFVEGALTGRGVFTWSDGRREAGEFRDGKHVGGSGTSSGAGSGTTSAAASGSRSGGTPAKNGGSELCQIAHDQFSDVNCDGDADKQFCDYVQDLGRQMVRGPNYKAQFQCVNAEVVYTYSAYVRNNCDYPVLFGSCITKQGPIEPHIRNAPAKPYELCDPVNPRPTHEPGTFWKFAPLDKEGGTFTGWVTDEYFYWAFTCEP